MIVMTPEATDAEIAAVRDRLETTGVHVLVLPGELVTAIGAIGDPEGVRELGLEGMAGVDRVVPISRPYKLASSELAHHEPTVFAVDGHSIGAPATFALIAGPCTVESREQTLGVARTVAAAGACMLRGGAFKPRTSPFAFKGLGAPGLEILAEARAETGLPIVTELLDAAHVDMVAAHADVIQIGARNMQNYALLEVAGKLGKPVLLKRGLSSSLDELLMAADYVLKEGNERVILCERGIRTFETATRFTLDLSAVPWLKLHSHLPVIVDPSHASGDRRLVEPLSRAAAAVGADGIIVEVHEDPELALCDGPQALYARDFKGFADRVAAHAALARPRARLASRAPLPVGARRRLTMPDAVIVDAVRTPIGRAAKGSLKDVRADDLAAVPLAALVERNPEVDFAADHDILMGCGFPMGEQGYNVGRNAQLLAGIDHHVPGGHRQPLLLVLAADAADGVPRDRGRRGRPVRRGRHRGRLALPARTRRSTRTRGSTAPTARRTTSTSRWGSRPRTWPSAATSRARRRTSGRRSRSSARSRRRSAATSTPRSCRSRSPTARR